MGPAPEGVRQACETVARGEKGQVEALAVEAHQRAGRGGEIGYCAQQGGLAAEACDQVLTDDQCVVREPREAHQEGRGAGSTGEPRGLGVDEQRLGSRQVQGAEVLGRLPADAPVAVPRG